MIGGILTCFGPVRGLMMEIRVLLKLFRECFGVAGCVKL